MEKKMPEKVSGFQQERAKGQITPFGGLGFVLKEQPSATDSFALRDVTASLCPQIAEEESKL